jgi:hypothetical protein
MIAPGRAHRPRARDRAVPAERDGAFEHVKCATLSLRTAPVRRRPAARSQPRGRPARAAEGRRAVALVSEIATPSNTSSPLNMNTTPPDACTRADAERSGAPCSCMRSRDASGGGTAHATCAACGCRACKQARVHAAMVVQLVTSPQELPVGRHGYFTSTTAAYACSIWLSPTAGASASAAS